MTIERKTLIARLRQIQTADMNALAIYKELSKLAKDDNHREIFRGIAQDEGRHIDLNREMLALLEN